MGVVKKTITLKKSGEIKEYVNSYDFNKYYHKNKKYIYCDICGCEVIEQHLKKHQETKKCRSKNPDYINKVEDLNNIYIQMCKYAQDETLKKIADRLKKYITLIENKEEE